MPPPRTARRDVLHRAERLAVRVREMAGTDEESRRQAAYLSRDIIGLVGELVEKRGARPVVSEQAVSWASVTFARWEAEQARQSMLKFQRERDSAKRELQCAKREAAEARSSEEKLRNISGDLQTTLDALAENEHILRATESALCEAETARQRAEATLDAVRRYTVSVATIDSAAVGVCGLVGDLLSGHHSDAHTLPASVLRRVDRGEVSAPDDDCRDGRSFVVERVDA